MKVQGTAVLVRPEGNPEQTKGGVVIPRTAKALKVIGNVLKFGPGCEEVKAGDRIQYAMGGCSIIEVEGETLHFINEDKIAYIY